MSSPQIPSLNSTPQQIADGIAKAKNKQSFATGKVNITLLVHNEDSDILLHSSFNEALRNSSPLLTMNHMLGHEIDLQPFAADDEADVSIKAITEDAVMAKLGPVEVKNINVLHVCGEVQAAKTILFVACTVESSEVPDVFMAELQWLPESALEKTDLKDLITLLGVDGIGRLLGAREHWKQSTAVNTIPDLVSSLPSTPAQLVTGESRVEAEEDAGYRPDSESSTGTDEARDISDVDEDYTLMVEDADDLPELVDANDFVFGDENLEKTNTGQGQQLTRYKAAQPRRRNHQTYSAAVDPETDEDEDDGFQNKKKPTRFEIRAERRVFQADAALTPGSRVPRKQQKKITMVDPTYIHQGPRFARPAQKVKGHRFSTKISRTKISLATDAAVKESHEMWNDLVKVFPEQRLI